MSNQVRIFFFMRRVISFLFSRRLQTLISILLCVFFVVDKNRIAQYQKWKNAKPLPGSQIIFEDSQHDIRRSSLVLS